MVKNEKMVDQSRFYWNPETKEKIYSHYQDGSEIVLSKEQQDKALDAKKACIKQSLKEVEETPTARKKPLSKRGRPKKEEVKEVKKE